MARRVRGREGGALPAAQTDVLLRAALQRADAGRRRAATPTTQAAARTIHGSRPKTPPPRAGTHPAAAQQVETGAPQADGRRRQRRLRGGEAGEATGAGEDGGHRDARALLRRRFTYLGLVLAASFIVAPLAGNTSPLQTFAVATGSMEPDLPVGALAFTWPGEPDVGDIIVYRGHAGDPQIHRIVEIRSEGDRTHYVTRGDANPAADSFVVAQDQVEGILRLQVPYAGYLWLLPYTAHVLLFSAFAGTYVAITLRDGGVARRRALQRIGPALIVVLLAASTALAGVAGHYPPSGHALGVADPSPLLMEEGPAGSASIGATGSTADAHAPPPQLWREVVLGGGADPVEVTATSLAAPEENHAYVDLGRFDPPPTFFLEFYGTPPTGETLEVALHDRTGDAVVAGSTVGTSGDGAQLVRSGAFTLEGAREYAYHARVTGGSGEVHQVKLLAVQPLPVEKTEAQWRLSGPSSTSGITATTAENSVRWRFDGDAMDGITGAWFEAVAEQSHGGGLLSNGQVRLHSLNAGSAITTLTLDQQDPKRYRSTDISSSLTAGHAYEVRIRAPDSLGSDSITLHLARIIIAQDGFERTVDAIELAGRNATGSDTYVAVGHPGRHHGDSEEPEVSTRYFEATLRSSSGLSGTTLARLVQDGQEVEGSEVSHSGTTRSRERSDAIGLSGANTSYSVELRATSGTTGTLFNAWIINHLDLSEGKGILHDHVLSTRLDAPVAACAVRFGLGAVTASDTGRMGTLRIDARVGAAEPHLRDASLPSARSFPSAVFDGTHHYLFGGRTSTAHSDQILRYDPVEDTLATMTAKLPTARSETSAVWDGTHAYVFGGNLASGNSDQILRYDPATDTMAVMGATLPAALRHTSAVWDGTHAYVFGGIAGSNVDTVIRYDPATDTATTMGATLPNARYGTSAVWDGTYAYVFGGSDGNFIDEIVRYDPAADAVRIMDAALPTTRYHTTATWDGTYAYVFGGWDTDYMDRVDRFDPVTGDVTTMRERLPVPHYGGASSFDGRSSHVFGGLTTGFVRSDQITRLNHTVAWIHAGSVALPEARYWAPAAWTGEAAYLFGGLDASHSATASILRHEPGRFLASEVDVVLPTARYRAAAAWDGTHVHVIGGWDGAYLSEIVRFDPSTGAVTTPHSLPDARYGAAAVWDGSHVYVIGGYNGTGYQDTILRYDPATGGVDTMTATLPGGRRDAGAVWTGTHVYVFGGYNGSSIDEVVRYDPATDTAAVVASLPAPRHGMAVAWTGAEVYLYGGEDGTTRTDQILRFDAGDETVSALPEALPQAQGRTPGVVWDGTHAHVLGGYVGEATDAILRHDPADGTVQDTRHVTRQSGITLDVRPGEALHHVLHTRPSAQGTTPVETVLAGTCLGAGIHTRQSVTYTFG